MKVYIACNGSGVLAVFDNLPGAKEFVVRFGMYGDTPLRWQRFTPPSGNVYRLYRNWAHNDPALSSIREDDMWVHTHNYIQEMEMNNEV